MAERRAEGIHLLQAGEMTQAQIARHLGDHHLQPGDPGIRSVQYPHLPNYVRIAGIATME